MMYYSTNKQTPPVSLKDAVVKGIAGDNGLFMPEKINKFDNSFFKNIEKLSFREIAFEVAQQYGKELAASVDRILTEDMKELSPRLKTAYSEVELSLSTPPSADDLSKMAARTSGYPKRWAERIVREINSGKTQIESYPYPVQVWQLGDQVIFSLGGELVIEYSVELRRIFGQDIFVMGYSNDVMGYIPSVRILREGGYEGATAQMVYGLPSTWRADIENRIMDEVLKVAGQCQIQLPESKLVSAP